MKRVGVFVVFLVFFSASAVCLAGDKLPRGMKGFSGMLRGKVVSKVKNGFVLKVEKVLKLWKGNKAENPRGAIGKQVLINTRWAKGDDGKWHPAETHVRFIKSLKVGQRIDIEARNEEGERLHILELSAQQRKHGQEKEGDKLPQKGIVVGEITQLKDLSFKLKVKDTGKGCKMLEGETLEFFVRHIKHADKWIPDPKQIKAFGRLRLGDTVKVRFYRGERWLVKKLYIRKRANKERVKELHKKQREAREREREHARREEREKKHARGRDREREEEREREPAREREEGEREHGREREEEERGREREHARRRDQEREEEREREEREEREGREEREAGERPRGWPKEGALVGTVTGIGATTLSVKVIEASRGAGEMVGETVIFYVNWTKNRDGRWVPNPEEVELFHSVELDDTVELRFYFQEHYRIRKLEKE